MWRREIGVVAKAKKLLAEAGHPDGISVDLHAADLAPGALAMVQIYQQMAQEAGIKVNIINVPAGEYWDTIWLKQPFAVSTWGMRTTPTALAVAYRKDAKWNETHFFRDEYDVLLEKAGSTRIRSSDASNIRKHNVSSPRRAGSLSPCSRA